MHPAVWSLFPLVLGLAGWIPMTHQNTIMRLKPGVGKGWLYLTAGLTWCGVGVLLNSYAVNWFRLAERGELAYLLLAGLLIGGGFYALIFARFAGVNIRRIDAYATDRICIFAFQRWSSYPLVIFMISLGIFLRKYSPIPKPYLAPLYFGIGTAIFIAGMRYFVVLLPGRRSGNRSNP